MKRETMMIPSEVDGVKLSVLMILPDSEPRAIVQLAHGMSEYKERYEPFMRYLAGKGFACVIHDHRGHGASVRSKKDLGYFYKGGADALILDLHSITVVAKNRWPGLKLILMGHSMGSLAVRAYAGVYDREIDGLIVSGSPGENKAVDMGLSLVKAQTAIHGRRYRSRLLYSMSIGSYDRTCAKRGIKGSWLSENNENAERYKADPLCGFRFTLDGYRGLLQLLKRAYNLPAAQNADLPIRFYSGADDPCAPDKNGFENAMDKMRGAGYKNVRGFMFKGMRHEILNEKDNEKVFEKILKEAILPVVDQKHPRSF